MRGATGFGSAVALGLVLGGGATLAFLASMPPVSVPDIAPIETRGENGETVESFFVETPADGVAVTHSGALPLAVFPPGVRKLSASTIDRGVAVIVHLRNAHGEIVGFASELEAHPKEGNILEDDVAWDTDWTVVLPGRGVLFLHQKERSGEIGPKVLRPVLETGEAWAGDWTVQTTVGPRADGRGVIVGGTGEFDGARGSFVEIDRVKKLTAEGVLEGRFELRIWRETEA